MSKRELMIVRHAKSDWSNKLESDFDRPLNSRGNKDIPRVAEWIHKQHLIPDLVITSPARRAQQTANIITEHLQLTDKVVVYDKRLYLASTTTLLSVISELDDSYNKVMLVGHNPGLEELIMLLSADELPFTENGKLLTTANFVMLQFNNTWQNLSKNTGKLMHFIRPRDLT